MADRVEKVAAALDKVVVTGWDETPGAVVLLGVARWLARGIDRERSAMLAAIRQELEGKAVRAPDGRFAVYVDDLRSAFMAWKPGTAQADALDALVDAFEEASLEGVPASDHDAVRAMVRDLVAASGGTRA